ncbi:hypothetical protein ACQPYE_40645 [Actinosynnema sp. CA-299493]
MSGWTSPSPAIAKHSAAVRPAPVDQRPSTRISRPVGGVGGVGFGGQVELGRFLFPSARFT